MFWFKSKKKKQEEANWSLQDFVNDLDTTMQKQADTSPSLQHVHAKLNPKWKSVHDAVLKTVAEQDDEQFALLCNDLFEQKDLALRAALEVARSLYHDQQNKENAK